jgi:membrane fusion protein, multidrug efflux system
MKRDEVHEIPGSDGDGRSRAWGHLIRRGVAVVLLAAVLVVAYVVWQHFDHGPRAEAAPPRGPVEVATVVVTRHDVPLRPRFLGQTEASQVVEIRSRVRGFLLERGFEEGQSVQQGQTLFRIDPAPFEATAAMARAQLASAQARLEQAQREIKRVEQLAGTGGATQTELEEARRDVQVAQADFQLEQARVRQAELDLGYTTVKAPIAGVIGRALKDVGSYVDDTSNSQLAVLRQVDPMYARYSVSEQELLNWQRLEESGQVRMPKREALELELTLADGRTYRHRGRINFVDVQVEPSTGTAVIRGTVPNPESTLRPGQFVHASVLGIERVDTIVVPQRAVIQSPAGSSVYVVNDKNVVEQRPVTLGEWQGEGWIIEKGLQPGERVVIDRLMQVRPGTPVAPVVVTPTTMTTTAPAR